MTGAEAGVGADDQFWPPLQHVLLSKMNCEQKLLLLSARLDSKKKNLKLMLIRI